MKTLRTHQDGSALAVVTVILVIALLAALGFIVYQNFIAPDDETTTDTTNTTTTIEEGAKLFFTDWNTEMRLDNGVEEASATKATDGTDTYSISISEQAAFSDESRTGTMPLGVVSRHMADDEYPQLDMEAAALTYEDALSNGTVKGAAVGDYIYVFTPIQQSTYENADDTARQEELVKVFAGLATKIRSQE